MKKKTVKELNEDLILMEKKLEKFEKIVNCLTAKMEAPEKQNKVCPNDNKTGSDNSKIYTNKYACKQCDCTFERNEELKFI